jgi:hypothetical protein
MTTYNTATLAAAILGEDAVDTNKKSATRELRKFLRDDMGEGKAVVGKGGRYALDLTKVQVNAMKKRFKAWEIAQAEAKDARRAALEAAATAKGSEAIILADEGDEDALEANEAADAGVTGPTDAEIAEMLEDDDEDLEEL